MVYFRPLRDLKSYHIKANRFGPVLKKDICFMTEVVQVKNNFLLSYLQEGQGERNLALTSYVEMGIQN